MKKALITGVTGQDGAYLAELLLSKGYEVHGIKRRTSLFNTNRIDHLYQDPHVNNRRLVLHYGDMTDSSSLIRIIQEVQPDEIYNLAAQSHVAVSFEAPEYTANSDALGTLRVLEAIRILDLEKVDLGNFETSNPSQRNDLAEACLFLMQKYSDIGFVNVGSGVELTIADLAKLIGKLVGYNGQLTFNTSRPDGTPRKLMDVSKLASMGWKYSITLEQGLKHVIETEFSKLQTTTAK